jgi:HSP20 family protein
MAIIRYSPGSILNPRNMFSNLQEEMNRLFDNRLTNVWDDESTSSLSTWRPRVDIKENGNKYTVIADLPGIDPKDIKVSMENNTLIIQGERKSESEEQSSDYHRIERFSGTFYRQFTLPEAIEINKISAKSKNGVLELSIPKTEKSATKLISIESES